MEDAREIFKKKVVGYFLKEYAAGKTPNPCVYCNEKVKFRLLLDLADRMKIGRIAAGHYARIIKDQTVGKTGQQKSYFRLLQGEDESKDQSYFLYRLKQSSLKRILFPLGQYHKKEVRLMAKSLNLPVHAKAESQNTCFLGDAKIETYFQDKLKLKKGKIINTEGEMIGEHNGLPLYTIGQRKGINIGGDGPYFVIAKNKKNNTLLVTNNPSDKRLDIVEIKLENISWPSSKPSLPFGAKVRTRYRNPLQDAIIEKGQDDRELVVRFGEAQKFISAGQSAVFYSEHGEVLGGGIIK